MPRKSSALRLAPPTRAPPTWGTANRLAAFAGRTEPPYRMRIASPLEPSCCTRVLADEQVHGGDVVLGGGLAGADSPDRLIGDDAGETWRQAAGQLVADHLVMFGGVALGFGLADADDRGQAGGDGGFGLGLDQGVGLVVILAALGMAEDDPGGAGVSQHGGGDVAGMGTLVVDMAVLAADGDRRSGQQRGDGGDLGERRANQQIAGEAGGAGP